MIDGNGPLGLAGLVVPLVGVVEATGVPFEPYRLVDPAGEPVLPASVFLADLQACGRSAATQLSYSLALLRWFRFLWSVEVPWDQATRVEARDFVRCVQVAGKPERRHWRGNEDAAGVRPDIPVPNRVTGKSPPGPQYAPATVAQEPGWAQVWDVRFSRLVTEWLLPALVCPCCGKVTMADAPAGAYRGSVSYGPGVNTAALLLTGYGNVPAERAADLIGMLTGIPVSAGFVDKSSSRLDGRLQDGGWNLVRTLRRRCGDPLRQ